MASRLFLVRHGPTHAKVMIGWTDLAADLSDHAALARLDAALPQDAPIITSDLLRARQTADALAAVSGNARPRLAADPDLREIHFGAWEGLHFTQAEAQDPALIRAFWDDPGDIAAPNGESWNMLTARIATALRRLPDGDVIVICHFGAILAALQVTLGLTATEVLAQKIEPLSLTQLHLEADIWRAERVNHLA